MTDIEAQDQFHEQEAQQPAQGYAPLIDRVEVEYIGKGTFQGGEEDASRAGINHGEVCFVVSAAEMDRVKGLLEAGLQAQGQVDAIRADRDGYAQLFNLNPGAAWARIEQLEKDLSQAEQNRTTNSDLYERALKQRDAYAEEASTLREYVHKLGELLGCVDGDATPEDRIRAYASIRDEVEKGRQWNNLLELELANLRSLKPTCYVCEQLMEQRGEDGTDFICVHCDAEYRKECERNRQMVAGKVADDQQHARAMALISERQAKELSELRAERDKALASLGREEGK